MSAKPRSRPQRHKIINNKISKVLLLSAWLHSNPKCSLCGAEEVLGSSGPPPGQEASLARPLAPTQAWPREVPWVGAQPTRYSPVGSSQPGEGHDWGQGWDSPRPGLLLESGEEERQASH